MRRVFAKLVFAILAVGGGTSAQTLQYAVHLQDYGWKPEPLSTAHLERSFDVTTHLAFDSLGGLYVGFALQGNAKLVRPGEANNLVRVLVLNALTGTMDKKLDYSTQSTERIGVNIAADDKLLVTANDKVQLIGKDGSPKATVDIPIPTTNISYSVHAVSVVESPTGKTLYFQVDWRNIYFLKTDSLSLIAHCEPDPELHYNNIPEAFSDNIKMSIDSTGMGLKQLVAGPLCGQPTVLWRYGKKVITPVLLNDSTVLAIGTSSKDDNTSTFEVRKISGEILWSGELPKHFLTTTLGPVRVTRDGGRFAEEDFELRGGSKTLDISSKTKSTWVRVFNSQTGKQFGAVPVAVPGISEFALSPEGHLVATLSLDGGTIEVWRMPDED